MAIEKLVLLKDAELSTNCPECFHKSLRLAFYQKHLFSKFYKKTTKQVIHQITCNKCQSNIYPGIRNPDIDRLFNYYEKMVVPEKAKTTYTAWYYMLLLGLVLIAVLAYLYYAGIIPDFFELN